MSKPAWIYDYISKCGSVSFGVVGAQDIPKYWTSTYLAIMQEAISALANHLHNSPYKSVVLGVRAAPNLIGTELWRVPAGSPCANSWSVTIGKQYYEQVMRQYHSTLLAAGIRPILRAVLFTEINPDPAIRTQLLGPDKSWIFATASSPDPDLPGREALDEFALQWVRTGRTSAYWEQSAHSKTSGNPVSWNYWHDLLELHKGVSYVARYASDLREAQDGDSNDAEYRASFEFVDKYAGHHTQSASSPGAWIAFRAGVRQPTGNYGWFMTQLDPAGTTVALDSNQGQSMIGPAEQRYGRYARRTDIATGKASFFLKLDPTFKQSIACGSARINITYLDTGMGSWAARWAAGAADVRVVNKTNSGRWRVATIDVSGASFAGALENGSDLLLQARTGDTTFHMVEVSRLGRC
jgi:hypothetical protein